MIVLHMSWTSERRCLVGVAACDQQPLASLEIPTGRSLTYLPLLESHARAKKVMPEPKRFRSRGFTNAEPHILNQTVTDEGISLDTGCHCLC